MRNEEDNRDQDQISHDDYAVNDSATMTPVATVQRTDTFVSAARRRKSRTKQRKPAGSIVIIRPT